MIGAIVGFGTIAMGHASGYSQIEGLQVVAVVDPSPLRRKIAEQRFSLRAYDTLADLLERESPDFIDICAPPSTHAEYIRRGIASGLHVLCEKPVLMPTGDGYEAFLDEIRDSDKIVYPCHNYKFAPILRLMDEIVREPGFGRVLGARFRTLRSGHALGVAEWDKHWRRKPDISGGGILRDHGPHSVYLATHLTRRAPVAVSCLLGNLRRDRYTTTEDTVMLTIRCEDDVKIMLDLSWAASFRDSYYSVTGTGGSVTVENDVVSYAVGGELRRTTLASDFDDPSHVTWFREMFLDFRETVLRPDRVGPMLQEALMTSLVIDSAYASAADGGRWITVGQARRGAEIGEAS